MHQSDPEPDRLDADLLQIPDRQQLVVGSAAHKTSSQAPRPPSGSRRTHERTHSLHADEGAGADGRMDSGAARGTWASVEAGSSRLFHAAGTRASTCVVHEGYARGGPTQEPSMCDRSLHMHTAGEGSTSRSHSAPTTSPRGERSNPRLVAEGGPTPAPHSNMQRVCSLRCDQHDTHAL